MTRIGVALALLALSCARGQVAPAGDRDRGDRPGSPADGTAPEAAPERETGGFLPPGMSDAAGPAPDAKPEPPAGGPDAPAFPDKAAGADLPPASDAGPAADAGGPLANGKPCSDGPACTSGSCVDGVCCASAACATCQSCALMPSPGTCASITKYVEDKSPAGACDGTRACDGAGACKKKNGQPCDAAAECVSNRCFGGECCAGVKACS